MNDQVKRLPLERVKEMVTRKPGKNFDCRKVIPKKCKAYCCFHVPFDKDWWEKHKHKTVAEYKILSFPDGTTLPLTENARCPFNDVKNGYTCAIYEDRPRICQGFGSDSMRCTQCPILKASGKLRGKKERNRFVSQMSSDINEKLGKVAEELTKLTGKEIKVIE